MKSLLLSLVLSILLLFSSSLTKAPLLSREKEKNDVVAASSIGNSSQAFLELYEDLNLCNLGLSQPAFFYAMKGYEYLLVKGVFNKKELLTICDMSQSSKAKRFYVINIEDRKIIINSFVAHGRNSGTEFAKKFSNCPESLQSSLGFYVTKETYIGEHGLSLKIEGLEKGFNDKAMRRAIVVHGANYIGERQLQKNPCMGRSFGCPAVPANESSEIINSIKNGTCFFIYHPTKKYLSSSTILNG